MKAGRKASKASNLPLAKLLRTFGLDGREAGLDMASGSDSRERQCIQEVTSKGEEKLSVPLGLVITSYQSMGQKTSTAQAEDDRDWWLRRPRSRSTRPLELRRDLPQ